MKRGAQISEFGHNAPATNIIFPQGGVLLAIEAGREGGVYGSSWLFSFSIDFRVHMTSIVYVLFICWRGTKMVGGGGHQFKYLSLFSFHFIHIFIQLQSTRDYNL